MPDVPFAARPVPFVSQQSFAEPTWRPFGCGIASLKMVLDYWGESADLDGLYSDGLAAGAFNDDFGWVHAGLVGLATARGFTSYNRDFGPRSRSPLSSADAFAELTAELAHGPVIASVYHHFDPAQGGGHLVVVTEVEDQAVRLIDPLPAAETQGRVAMPRSQFLPAFKHRYIVVRPT